MPRKSAAEQAKTMEETNAFDTTAQVKEDVQLSDDEKTALEVQEKQAQGSAFSGKFKLKNPDTSFSDPEFTLAGDQEKELPENPSMDLIARIRSGFIVKA